jgi:hypothetical protein
LLGSRGDCSPTCSLLKAALDFHVYHHRPFSEGCALDVFSFVSKGADCSTMSNHSLLAARWKTRLLASRLPVRESI